MAMRNVSDVHHLKRILSVLRCFTQRAKFESSHNFPRLDSAVRNVSTTPRLSLREVKEKVEDNVTTIEGEYVDSVRKESLLNRPIHPIPGTCPLCEINVKYTDVLIINQFIKPDGSLLPKEITGLCPKKQVEMQRLIYQSQSAGLLPNRKPLEVNEAESHYKSQYKWKKFNVYFTPGKRYQVI